VLYNLHRARTSIARSGEVFVVEGYTDVIGLGQGGIENAVATCGTALGEKHLELLSRFAQRAVLAFDSDEAGARAAERAYAFVERFPIQPVVMILPDGLDPADMVAKHGADAIREAASRAKPLLEYMVRRIVGRHELGTIEQRSAAVADALPVLEQLSDPVRRSGYAHLLADLVGVEDTSVLEALDRRLGGRPKEVARAMKRGTARERVEREMLKLLTRDADTFRTFVSRLGEDHFGNASHRRAFVALRDADGDVSSLVAGADERLGALIAQLAVEPLEGDPSEGYAEGVWARLQEFLLRSRSEALRVRLQKLDPTSDPSYEQLFRELVAVDGDLRRLRDGVRDVV